MLLDNSLLLWRFDKRDGQLWEHRSEEQRICAVGLVKPRTDFVTAAQYLLVLATPVELLLFGVCCCSKDDEDPLTQISVQKLVEYTASSHGVTMTCIACTDEGRVFLAGHNGRIYELLYPTCPVAPPCRIVCCTPIAEGEPFKKFNFGAVVEMVVDNERKILYARTEKNKLEAYFLGMNGKSTIVKVGKENGYSIVSISPLSKLESRWSHGDLVAVLSDGRRMYLSTSVNRYTWKEFFISVLGIKNDPPPPPPNCLRFVTGRRCPPTHKENPSMKVETAYSSVGTLFLSHASPHPTSSSLVIVGQDSSLHRPIGLSSFTTLREVGFRFCMNGRMLFVADVLPTPDTASTELSLYSEILGESCEKTCGILRGRGDLLTQHILPKTKTFLVSTTSVTELVFNRPVDMLINILKQGEVSTYLQSEFVAHFGADETAAMCLMLASGIMRGFYEIDSLVSVRAANLYEDMKQQKMPQDQFGKEPILSAANGGLYLLTSRLLYPIWNACVLSTSSDSDGVVICRLRDGAVDELESKIRSLEKFLIPRSEDVGSTGGKPVNKTQRLSEEDALSMEGCRHLLVRSAEALCLLKVLTRHHIGISTRRFERLKFYQLVYSPEADQIAKVIIYAIMESLAKSRWECVIKEELLACCPSYSRKPFSYGDTP